MPNLNQEDHNSFCLCILRKTGSEKSQDGGGCLWPDDWVIFVCGPILTNQYEDCPGAEGKSSSLSLNLVLPGLARSPRKHAEEMTTLFGC